MEAKAYSISGEGTPGGFETKPNQKIINELLV